LISCRPVSKNNNIDYITIWQAQDSKGINPIFVRDAFSNYLCMQIFQPLTAIDFRSEEVVGVLAMEAPEVENLDSNRKKITFQLRPSAAFDKEHAISAKDVIFSVKLHLLKIPASTTSQRFDFIEAVTVHPEDSMRIDFIVEDQSNVDFYCGAIQLMPQHIYDPNNILDQFSIEMLKNNDTYKSLELKTYIGFFTQLKFSQSQEYIYGSGPYYIESWKKDQNILLKKKSNWYGDKLSKENSYFEAKPSLIRYEIIDDEQAAIISLKSGKIDLLSGISAKSYHSLKGGNNNNYTLYSSPKLGYNCIGFNLENKFLSNLQLRKALAHSIDKELILEIIFYNLGKTTNVPMAAIRQEYYNNTLIPYQYDLQKAIEILDNAQIIDHNNDGWREMEVEGKMEKVELTYEYNANNKERERIGIILKNNAKKIGIDIDVRPLEWNVYLQKLRDGYTEIFYSAVSSSWLPPNFEGSFHSTAIKKGRNYFNYKNEKVDAIIDEMNQTEDKQKYKSLIMDFQLKIHQDVVGIFLFSNEHTFVVSNTLNGFYTSNQRPNYWAPSLEKLNEK